MSDPARSAGLDGRERIAPERPPWAAAHPGPGLGPLPLVTAEAVAAGPTRATARRLAGLNRDRHLGRWTGHVGELRERAAVLRRETLRDLEGYLDALAERVEAAGGVVHRAATPAEAVDAVLRIAHRHGVRLAVKAKSMTTEEIELNRHLEGAGVEVVETDLGEFILQVADERPSHIIAPAVHKSQSDVSALFAGLAGAAIPDTPQALARFARERLRADFHAAQLGITGVNFACADTGTLVLVTNEGNGRMTTSQPPVHVAVMTPEKVIARFTDLATLLPLLSYAGAAQHVSVYQTLLTGPRRPGEADGPAELHLVIVDNGRSRLLGTRYEEVLACIRCGSCQLACPVYRTVGGGQPYLAAYGGPIGAVLSPLLGDRSAHRDLPFLSSLCGACADACPVKIPLPDLLYELRADALAARPAVRAAWSLWAGAWSRPVAFRASVRAAGLLGRALPARALAGLPGLPRRWGLGRALPSLRAAGTVRRRLGGRGGEPRVPAGAAGAGTARPPAAQPPPEAAPLPGDAAALLGVPAPGTPGSARLADRFAERLGLVGGQAHRCASRGAALELVGRLCAKRPVVVDRHPDLTGLEVPRLVTDPWAAEVGVTGVFAAAAETGTLALVAAAGRPRSTSLVPEVHIAVLPESRVLASYAELLGVLAELRPQPSSTQLITGPSRSADIEMKPVVGMHGPREVHVVLFPDHR